MMKYLCDNPACSRHCLVEYRSYSTDGSMAWQFVGGNRGFVEKELLDHLDPDKHFNLCRACHSAFELGEAYARKPIGAST